MKVAIVTLYNPFEKIHGGIESVVRNLSISLVKHGVETWILTMGNVEKEIIKSERGVNVWIISDRGHKGLFIRSLIFIKEGRKAIIQMNNKYNIDIFNGQSGYSAPLAFVDTKNIKTILTVHTIDGENLASIAEYWRMKKYKKLLTEIFKYPILKIWRSFYFYKSDALTFVSRIALREYRMFYSFIKNKEEAIIENGSPNINDIISIRKKYDFIYTGRIDKPKGVDLVIRAASLLKQNGLKFNVIIIGDGPWKKDFEELTKKLGLEKIVIFEGYLEHNDLLKLVSKSKFLILPSFYESDPLVIKESFQIGIPVIVSNIPSSKEKIINNKNGYIFKKGDYHDLYNIMNNALLINEETYSTLSTNAKKSIKEKTWDDIAKKYIEFFDKVTINA